MRGPRGPARPDRGPRDPTAAASRRTQERERRRHPTAAGPTQTAEIKSKVDLIDLVAETVSLRKAGASYKGLCPFHGERTPSFVVTPARETWKCFGCGKGGDVFSFVMERDGVTFPEALRRLAARAGVELDERSSREDARRKRLGGLLESAIAWYHAVLTASRAGEQALAYLHGRGFTDATIDTYQLGYAPDAWDGLARALIAKRGATEEDLVEAGLASRSQRARSASAARRPGVYDVFRGRVMFPIRDASGHPTGFGGRILAPSPDGREPKYLNTRATPLFDKSRTLYLIDRAKGPARKLGRAVIVEGYTDALMAHQAGFENVVGGLGTALTAGQVELVTRYAPSVALAYDVDAAGQGAGTFGATELSALIGEIERSPHRGRLTEVGVVRLPEGKDPDEVIRDEPETWRAATDAPQPIMEYLIDHYVQRFGVRTQSGRERIVAALLPILRTVSDPVRRDGFVGELSRRALVDDRVIAEALRQPSRFGTSARGAASATRGGPDGIHAGARINLDAVLAGPDVLDPRAVEATLLPAEATLLRLALLRPDLQPEIAASLAPEDLETTPARELWRGLLADRGADPAGRFERDRFLAALDPALAGLARALYARAEPESDDPQLAIRQCLLALRKRRLDETVEFKRAEFAEAEAAADAEARARLGIELRELQAQRIELDRTRQTTTLLTRHRSHPTEPITDQPVTGGTRR
ncbi:MAG TPA: DNA primase [Candidatus Limnocylindrales bacterium]|nr:DNA primase [Candidatus Limnocylindrales bacterium]